MVEQSPKIYTAPLVAMPEAYQHVPDEIYLQAIRVALGTEGLALPTFRGRLEQHYRQLSDERIFEAIYDRWQLVASQPDFQQPLDDEDIEAWLVQQLAGAARQLLVEHSVIVLSGKERNALQRFEAKFAMIQESEVERIAQLEILPYDVESIGIVKASGGRTRKITIPGKWLPMVERFAQFGRVPDIVEPDIWLLQEIDEIPEGEGGGEKVRLAILYTIMLFEQNNNVAVKRDGLIGEIIGE